MLPVTTTIKYMKIFPMPPNPIVTLWRVFANEEGTFRSRSKETKSKSKRIEGEETNEYPRTSWK